MLEGHAPMLEAQPVVGEARVATILSPSPFFGVGAIREATLELGQTDGALDVGFVGVT
jgi:hypothetical protein